MLDNEWSKAHPGKNFLDDETARYAGERVAAIGAEGGTAERDRLERNLLSSMPLCFNLFGFLRQHRDVAAAALRSALDITINEVTLIEVEWAPDPHPLGDRTAFDAYVEYRTDDGEPGFLGIETKYTELFSQKRYESDRYTEITEAPHSGFRPGASGRLASARTNQLWRNTMLALAHTTQRFNQGFSVVLHAAGDGEIGSAIEAFYAEREEPGSLLRVVTYERLIDAVAQEPGATEWAGGFRKRYLDLSPVR